MTELKVGYRAVFFDGEKVTGTYGIKKTYKEAEKDISLEIERIEKYDMIPFGHAKVEKVYYRH